MLSIEIMAPIAILLGSSRSQGNAAGLYTWIDRLFVAQAATIANGTSHHLHMVDPHIAPHPLGPVLDPIIPAAVKSAEKYASPAVREWSRLVSSCPGFIILTPQYNWGYPGELKNALDQLYHEWRGKPVLIVTYGGHGGGKCAEQLSQVLEGALKMRVVGRVGVTLPEEYIRGDLRVGGETPEFLRQYDAEATKGIETLLMSLNT